MSDAEPAESCQVTLLIPHPTRTAVLVADEAAAGPATSRIRPAVLSLPTVRMNSAEPRLTEILHAVDVVDTGTSVALRLVMTSAADGSGTADGESDEVSLVLELDACATEPRVGWTWQDLDAGVVARLEPVTCRAAVASWASERAHGWQPLRPPWSRPGWFERARVWMLDQMAADGRPAIGVPRQHQVWGLSVVLSAPSAGGNAFLKCSPAVFQHEAVLTQALAERMPGLVPEVIAVDGAEGWLLMRDLGAAELGDQEQSVWHEGLAAHAAIQRSWLGRTDELMGLGLPVRSLTDLALQIEATTEDAVLTERMPPELRDTWLATTPALVESCRRLDEIGPGPTLVHGDLHPWNVTFAPGSTRVFDWTDAAVSHPFVDLATYVLRADVGAVRRHLVDAYVGAWSGVLAEETLREAATLGLVVGSLYQVQSYRSLLPTLTRNGADDGLADADIGWIKQSLACHEHGLESRA